MIKRGLQCNKLCVAVQTRGVDQGNKVNGRQDCPWHERSVIIMFDKRCVKKITGLIKYVLILV